ncbi:MAG: hypothetical protein A2040_03375 [Rhodocyclales bacterium GWA2_65_19]|nr:MAG: hypothetical protein A2040_03375 [Rhodocyclales bacterium GWA2_65_19]
MLDTGSNCPSRTDILRVVLIYAVFAGLWILLSDRLTEWLLAGSTFLAVAQTLKGWLFVGVTSLLLYFLLKKISSRSGSDNGPGRYAELVDWKPWQLYLFAVVITIITLLIRQSIAVSFGERPLLVLFMFPIILSAALGGFGPGVASTLIAVLSVKYFGIPPTGSLRIEYSHDLLQLGFLLAEGLLVSYLSMMLHAARYRSEQERQKAETSLAEKTQAMQLLDGIAQGSTDAIFAKDTDDRFILFNPGAERFTGKSAKDVLGHDETALFPPEIAEQLIADNRKVMESNQTITFTDELVTQGGRSTFLTTKGPLRDGNGQVIGMFGIARNITEIKAAEEQLRKLSLAVEQSPECIAIANLDAETEYVNEAFVRTSGYSREELIGRNQRIHHSGRTPQDTYDGLWNNLTAGKVWQGEFHNKRKDGSEYTVHAIVSPIRDPDGRITHYVAVEEDITGKKRAEEEIHRLAFYDTLTGLPNRALLLERMTQTLATTRRGGHHSALISFDIDRFKTVNDAGGHAMGDALLKAVGERLSHILREGDVIARIAGDEFGVLLTDLAAQKQAAAHFAMHIAEKIHASLREPFVLGTESVSITASLGIALFPEDSQDTPLDVLRRTSTALHGSKKKGSGATSFFEGALDEAAKQRFDIERELHQALAAGELRVFLQPQVDAKGIPVGAEALVRWQHPARGLVLPGAFIPIAEESSLIVEIGIWVLAEVCRLLAGADLADQPLRISVNISPRHFRQPDFVDQVRHCLAATGADPTRITLEVTEGMIIDNINDVIAKMHELSAMGIHFSMDDFGTGYSSLSYLKRLPIHEIKIDKTFVQDMTTDANDAALVEVILAVAKHLHLKVVAEGVETAEQAEFLNRRGQVIHQGYLFGKPEPAEQALPKLIRTA